MAILWFYFYCWWCDCCPPNTCMGLITSTRKIFARPPHSIHSVLMQPVSSPLGWCTSRSLWSPGLCLALLIASASYPLALANLPYRGGGGCVSLLLKGHPKGEVLKGCGRVCSAPFWIPPWHVSAPQRLLTNETEAVGGWISMRAQRGLEWLLITGSRQ